MPNFTIRATKIINDKTLKFFTDNGIKIVLLQTHKVLNGTQAWYQNGQLHRTDGPSIEYANGNKFWYIEGKEYSEQEFTATVEKMQFIEGVTVVE